VLEIERLLAYIQATMTAIKKRTRKTKRDLYGEDAQSLFLAGKSLEEIQDLLPVSLVTLKRWHQEGQWEEKRRQVPVSPRWLGEALKGILREKAGRLIIKGDLKTQELDEITKTVTLLDRLCSQGWDMRAAALEVMDRFSDFLRGWVKDQEELKRISHRVQEFFRQLEEEL
jgi:transposase